jgi:hypothetical protein
VWQNSLHNRETTGKLLGNSSSLTKIRPENICEFSRLRDLRDEIPCATEQGINSTTTGNLIPANRELIRDNRELAKIDPLAAMKCLSGDANTAITVIARSPRDEAIQGPRAVDLLLRYRSQ